MKIHVVVGQTGEKADKDVWNVKAFYTYDAAKDFVKQLNNIIDDVLTYGYKDDHSFLQTDTCYKLETALEKLDPDVSVDHNGVEYGIEELELV